MVLYSHVDCVWFQIATLQLNISVKFSPPAPGTWWHQETVSGQRQEANSRAHLIKKADTDLWKVQQQLMEKQTRWPRHCHLVPFGYHHLEATGYFLWQSSDLTWTCTSTVIHKPGVLVPEGKPLQELRWMWSTANLKSLWPQKWHSSLTGLK